MRTPRLFLDIEASSPDEEGYPVVIAWSTRDGVIRNVLVCPDDDWTEWDSGFESGMGLTREHLIDQGLSCKDVARLLAEDLAEETVYVDGLDPDELWLERLFEAARSELPFEIAPMNQFPELADIPDLFERKRELLDEEGLTAFQAEHNVYVMLRLCEKAGS